MEKGGWTLEGGWRLVVKTTKVDDKMPWRIYIVGEILFCSLKKSVAKTQKGEETEYMERSQEEVEKSEEITR